MTISSCGHVALIGALQFDERFCQHGLHNRVIVEVQPLEEGEIKLSSAVVTGGPVQLAGLVEQSQVGLKNFGTDAELLPCFLQAILGPLAIDLHSAQASVNLVARKLPIGSEINQALLFDIQLAKLSPVPVMQVTYGLLLIPHDSLDQRG